MCSQLYKKAINYENAIANKCDWCIPRVYRHFDCQFNQGEYFDYPCSKNDYKRCVHYQDGEKIKEKRGW